MAVYPQIALQGRGPDLSGIQNPAQQLNLETLKRAYNWRHASQRDELSQRVKKQAVAAYDALQDAPEEQRMSAYEKTWAAAIDDIVRTGLAAAAGISPAEIQQARSQMPPPDVARSGVMSLSDIQKYGEERTLNNAYTFNDRGELDVEATVKKLSRKPELAYKVLRQTQEHEATLLKRSNEAAEIERRRTKDEQGKQQGKLRDEAKLFFAGLQRGIASGLSEEDAIAQARELIGAQQASFDPDQFMAETPKEGEEGAFIQTGMQPVAKKRGPLSEEMQNFKQDAGALPPLGKAMPLGEDYDWRWHDLYNMAINPKYNPATAKFGYDYRTGRPRQTLVGDYELKRAKEGAPSVSVDWGKPAQNKLEQEIIDYKDGLQRLERLRSAFKPEYLTYQRQWESIWSSFKQKAGINLTPAARQSLKEYAKFRRTTLNNINTYIKAITGAAMSESEAARITAAMPNMDDAPDEFQSKMEDVIDDISEALTRYGRLREGGPNAVLSPTQKAAPKGEWKIEEIK